MSFKCELQYLESVLLVEELIYVYVLLLSTFFACVCLNVRFNFSVFKLFWQRNLHISALYCYLAINVFLKTFNIRVVEYLHS